MNINYAEIETAYLLITRGIQKQNLPAHLKKRWQRALEKAKERLVEQPFFAWQPERLLIVSVPRENAGEIGCRFYEANEAACRRVDKSGLCQAFFEGFPCWHRAAFLLLKIYVGETCKTQPGEKRAVVAAPKNCQLKVSTLVDSSANRS